jgi:flagellar protein FlgJ
MALPVAPGDAGAALAIDAGALNALKRQANASPKEALSAAATQFEALFVQMMLKSMRDALPKDGPFASETTNTYTTMFDHQLAQQMAKRGIGLRQVLERQLAPTLGGNDAAKASAATGASPVNAAKPVPAAKREAVTNTQSSSATRTEPHADSSKTSSVPARVREFIEAMRPHAEAAARAIGVPADLLLAQAGLETGWGKSQPRTGSGETSHNMFGIKAGKSWSGATTLAATTEYVAGALVRTVDRFRSYKSYTEAFADFGALIAGNARYADAMKNVADPLAYAKALQRGGYATDPNYADKLVHAIRMVASGSAATGAATQVAARRAVNVSDQA